MSLLSLERVSKRFDGLTAVDGVSFTVDRGQVVGFLGPNGAGKSTTMRMITQIFEPDGGEIRFDGVPLSQAGRDAKRRIGFLPENNPLYGEMLVTEYLDFVARLRELAGQERSRAIDEAVASTGIEPVFHRPIGELSKGYKQRVGLAAAILHRPDLLILDEPTEGLDPNQRVEIRHLIAHLGRERTVMLSTHVLPEVQHTCSRLLIINQGRLVADGSVDELVSRATAGVRVTIEASGADVGRRVSGLSGVRDVEVQDAPRGRVRVSVSASGDTDLRPHIFEMAKAEGWTLYELHQETGSLEDLFRQLTHGDGAAAPAAERAEAAA
ncbi:MAG TPA: ATP-binding cassette domain-containing protein [Gemmatimonadaceae bacterium]|nr:ATP-binding cassette domain-containing protein [Gemmatimonadaceae bacterium]